MPRAQQASRLNMMESTQRLGAPYIKGRTEVSKQVIAFDDISYAYDSKVVNNLAAGPAEGRVHLICAYTQHICARNVTNETYVDHKLLHRKWVGVKPICKFYEVGYECRVLIVQL